MFKKIFVIVAAVSVSYTLFAQTQRGTSSAFTNDKYWEVPGTILKPGSYQIRVDDIMSDRSVLEILNGDGTAVLTTFLSVPNRSLRAEAGSNFVFWKSDKANPVVRGWAVPGESAAREFVYEKAVAARIATGENEPVPAIDPSAEPRLKDKNLTTADLRAVQLWALSIGIASSKKEKSINAERLDRSSQSETNERVATKQDGPSTPPRKSIVEQSQSQSTSRSTYVATSVRKNNTQLPATASNFAIIIVVGLFSLCGALSIRYLTLSGRS